MVEIGLLTDIAQEIRVNNDHKNALISVYNKTGIVPFAQKLIEFGWRIYASGGTAKALKSEGIPVTDIETLVGEPILGHRVVTLSREIHAGLLARNTPEDIAELKRLNIPWIELVCVDLYPLEEEIGKKDATMESVVEKTDIGGPTMLRSGAKGRRLVISNMELRHAVLKKLEDNEADEPDYRDLLAMEAERCVSEYCMVSADYLHTHLVNKATLSLSNSVIK